MPMFKTSLKMFKANSILGLGPKSYRYFCVKYFLKENYKKIFKLYIKGQLSTEIFFFNVF